MVVDMGSVLGFREVCTSFLVSVVCWKTLFLLQFQFLHLHYCQQKAPSQGFCRAQVMEKWLCTTQSTTHSCESRRLHVVASSFIVTSISGLVARPKILP